MLELRSIKDIKQLAHQRVLMRLDLDVPVGKAGLVNETEDRRLRQALPTLKYLLRRKAEIIILGHRDRPGGRANPDLTLRPVVERLASLLGSKTKLAQDKHKLFDGYTFRVSDQTMTVLENLRFDPGERHNDARFAKRLAGLGDVYINDAFANTHRRHASMSALPRLLPSYAGLNLLKEVQTLGQVLKRPRRPLTLVVGGVKGATKLKLVEKFIPRADYILIGSGLASNFYKALGFSLGASHLDSGLSKVVNNILKRPQYSILRSPSFIRGLADRRQSTRVARGTAKEGSDKLTNILLAPRITNDLNVKILKQLRKRVILPVDVRVGKLRAGKSSDFGKDAAVKEVSLAQSKLCGRGEALLDIGPRTARLYCKIIKRSGTVVWNGPLGFYEHLAFEEGTRLVAEAVADSRGKGIVGGGDTEAALEAEHIKLKRNVFVSTGGGSMLEFLLNPRLPGIVPLIKGIRNQG